MNRMLAAALAAVVGAGAIGTAVASAETTPTPPAGAPSTFFKKNVRMDVSLQDTTGLVFDASLAQVAASMPARFATYLEHALDGEIFSVDATGAKCFIDDGTTTKAATCQQVADLVDVAADAVPATVLAKPVPGTPLDFVAKKVIAHSEGVTGVGLSQAARLEVSLAYASSDTAFDATLDHVSGSVPSRLAALIDRRLGDGSFTLDASKAVCSIVTNGSSALASCADVADLVNSSYDTVSATAVGRLSIDTDGTSTFVATKVVADADSATSDDTSGTDYSSDDWQGNGSDSSDDWQGNRGGHAGGGWWAPVFPGHGHGPGPFGRNN